ncbi:MAG: undecaprenyl-diphosphate phosphatase [Candidatus Cloacimonadaceae bacterium]|nr:undecaprenyl-diphosphate phosphatase [Candidatus Cloacimonadaceae bacterium]
MNFFTSILMGILQGLTEFLPVSSSGHLVLAGHLFGIKEDGNIFEVFLHLGTLMAVLIYFRKTLWDLVVSLTSWRGTLRSQVHRHNRLILLYLIIATIGTSIIYLLFGDFFKSLYDKPMVVAFMLLITGSVVFISDYVKTGSIPSNSMGIIRALIIGLAQGLAIIPGLSRSGATIGTSLYCGLKRKDAAYFSFLLSIPAILAANISEFGALRQLETKQFSIYLGGFLASFAVGYLVMSILIQLIQQNKLKYFAYYCWFIGLSAITLLSMN